MDNNAIVSRKRWALALIVGTILYLVVVVGSQVIPSVFLPGELKGLDYAWVGLFQLVLGLPVIAFALSIAKCSLRDVGLSMSNWGREAGIGAVIAIIFAIIQFGFIIPATGGAERSDVVTNLAQIGGSWLGVFGFVVLAWTGAALEEVFFRGHFLNTLKGLISHGKAATYIAAITTIVLFAALHGYQGWAGVIDSGLYGGLTLTLLYLWRRNLTACIVAHALWNSLASVLLLVLY